MDKTISLKGWLFCENQRVSAGDYKNFPQTPQILAEFIHKIILSYHLLKKKWYSQKLCVLATVLKKSVEIRRIR
jgi:hypothetical protein